MKVLVDDYEYDVRFSTWIDKYGRVTSAHITSIYVPEGYVVDLLTGNSFCNSQDNFRHDIGRLQALKRATKGWPREKQRTLLKAIAAQGTKLRAYREKSKNA